MADPDQSSPTYNLMETDLPQVIDPEKAPLQPAMCNLIYANAMQEVLEDEVDFYVQYSTSVENKDPGDESTLDTQKIIYQKTIRDMSMVSNFFKDVLPVTEGNHKPIAQEWKQIYKGKKESISAGQPGPSTSTVEQIKKEKSSKSKKGK